MLINKRNNQKKLFSFNLISYLNINTYLIAHSNQYFSNLLISIDKENGLPVDSDIELLGDLPVCISLGALIEDYFVIHFSFDANLESLCFLNDLR
jgi:hypothetical protein